MKRFWLFVYSEYEPMGGMLDFKKDYNSPEEALHEVRVNPEDDGLTRANKGFNEWHIFDSENKTVLYKSGGNWDRLTT